MEDPEDHRIDLEIIFCNFKDKKQNFQNSIQADILDNISKKSYQPGNFDLFEFSSRGSDEMMEDRCVFGINIIFTLSLSQRDRQESRNIEEPLGTVFCQDEFREQLPPVNIYRIPWYLRARCHYNLVSWHEIARK